MIENVINLGSFEPKLGHPYAIFFVYPAQGKACIVKGMPDQVEDYVNTHFPECIYRITYWGEGESRGIWRCNGRSVYFVPKRVDNRVLTKILMFKNGKDIIVGEVRRIPKRWLEIYDEADNTEV